MATYWENSCSFGLRYVSWYKCLIVSLFFPTSVFVLLVPFFGRALPLDGLEESSKVMFISVHESCNKFLTLLVTSLVVVSTNTFLKLPPRNFPIQSSRVKFIYRRSRTLPDSMCKKVQVGNNQENAQSEKDSHSKNRGGKKLN